MTRDERKQLEPLDYDANISIEEAREKLAEVEGVINAVSAKYALQAGSKEKQKTVMDEGDNAYLSSCLGVLLPLQLQPSVQAEYRSTSPDKQQDTVLARSSILMQESLLEAGRFSNTGVTVFYGEQPLREGQRRTATTKLIQAPKVDSIVDRIRRRIGK